jgi:hypothetical protein
MRQRIEFAIHPFNSDEFQGYLERVTLALEVELAVQVAINLLLLTVLLQQTTQHTDAADPDDL